jgi:hypothetical protein
MAQTVEQLDKISVEKLNCPQKAREFLIDWLSYQTIWRTYFYAKERNSPSNEIVIIDVENFLKNEESTNCLREKVDQALNTLRNLP